MKNIIVSFGLCVAIFAGFTSCKNDLKVLAPGKEMVSVYGVLNPNETVQNIRINKVFVTDGDATIAATDANTVNYAAGELVVTLQRFMSGSTTPTLTTVGNATKKEIVLTETVVTTADGAFANQQRIWQTTDALYPNGEYKLVIKKASDLTTELASAQTIMIDSVKPGTNTMPFCYYNGVPSQSYPMHGGYVLDVPPGTGTKQGAYVDYSNLAIPNYSVNIKSIANAIMYSATIRFHYKETTSSGTNNDYVDFNLLGQTNPKLTAGDALTGFVFSPNDFYTNLAREIDKKANPNVTKRNVDYMEYIVSAGTENLYTFLQVNAPSNTIAQDKPYYTNITNGVGIFACRTTSRVTKDLWNDFIDKIACDHNTFHLLFCDSGGTPRASACN